MDKGICKNCGADYGLHHYITEQCPVGGRAFSIDRVEEWKTSRYESVNTQSDIIKELVEALELFLERIEEFGSPTHFALPQVRAEQALAKYKEL